MNGYGRDVGTKTTVRITYPEGAIQKPERYEKDSLFVFSAFKPLDFKWLRQMVFKEKLVRNRMLSLKPYEGRSECFDNAGFHKHPSLKVDY